MLSKSKQGVKVARVTGEEEGKPVDIQVNDELIEVNGTKVEGMELEAILKLILKNKRVKVRLNRDGKDISGVRQVREGWRLIYSKCAPESFFVMVLEMRVFSQHACCLSGVAYRPRGSPTSVGSEGLWALSLSWGLGKS